MKEFDRNESPTINLIQLTKQDTGLKYDLYLYTSASVKEYLIPIVEIDYSKDYTPVLVLSAKEIRLIKKSDIKTEDFEEICDYLKRNYEIIVKHWNSEILDKEVLDALCKRKKETNV